MRALFKRIHMLYKRIKELKILLSKSYMAYTPLRGVFTRDLLLHGYNVNITLYLFSLLDLF